MSPRHNLQERIARYWTSAIEAAPTNSDQDRTRACRLPHLQSSCTYPCESCYLDHTETHHLIFFSSSSSNLFKLVIVRRNSPHISPPRPLTTITHCVSCHFLPLITPTNESTANMAPLFPRHDAFTQCFTSPLTSAPKQGSQAPAPDQPTRWQARPELYGAAYSTIDNVKDKAQKISTEATKEFEKASAKAQAKAGTIELYSGKYYAACTFGGMMACVSRPR